MLPVLPLAKVQAHAVVYNSACWAKVAVHKDAASTSKGVEVAYPAQHLLYNNHQWTMKGQYYSEDLPVDH